MIRESIAPAALGDFIREIDTQVDSTWGNLYGITSEDQQAHRAVNAMLAQAVPIRDKLAGVWRLRRDDDNMQLAVVGLHRSRSITLPVYRLTVPCVGTFYMRNNFFDWKVTALLEIDVSDDTWGDLFDHAKIEPDTMFEGFEHDWIKKSFDNDRRAFSVSLDHGFEHLYVFHFMLRREMIRLGREDPRH